MSQFFIGAQPSGPLPPNIPTSFVTDNGTAIPSSNTLNVNGGETSIDNDNGIMVIANPDLSNNLEILLTNRLQGIATSVNGSVEDLITFNLGSASASYRFEFEIAGRDTSTNDCIGYTMFGSAKTDGSTSIIIASPFIDNDEDSALISASLNLVSSGNDVIVQVTGVLGQTINYKGVGTYVVV